MNDPWTPQPPASVILQPAPVNPLHQLISSDRYIDSLEKKLCRMKGRSVRDPTSQDIVKSLSKFRDDQMEHFLKGETIQSTDAIPGGGEMCSASYIQRRLYPEKQPVTGEELVVLLQDDALAKRVEEEQEVEELLGTVIKATDAVARQQEVIHIPVEHEGNSTVAMETDSFTNEKVNDHGTASPELTEQKS